ncbi:hypothetical protein [Streptomyces sp. NPDC059008]|uniref:hypothetical protein n=1 Tax=unclassified Streptomyces TaxID=2593676 RepID=UPI0036ADC9E1
MQEEGFSVWETGVSRGGNGSAGQAQGRRKQVVPGGTAAVPVQPCDLVTVPARQGLEAVDILRLRDGVGPVLHDGACDTLGFLVPAGTADGWDVPGSACTQTYGRAGVPAGEGVAAQPPVTGTGWLVSPEGAGAAATDPVVLRAALGEAARTIEACDRCQ